MLETPAVDAIVVLSVGRVVAPGKERVSEWGDANRFFGDVELYQAGKAALLVFTGAWISWEPDAPLEGDVLAAQARTLGVPGDRILVTGRGRTPRTRHGKSRGCCTIDNLRRPASFF